MGSGRRKREQQEHGISPAEGERTVEDGVRTSSLLEDIRGLITSARQRVATAVNTELVMLYWHIGERIKREMIGPGRAAYGEQVVAELSERLSAEYGRGFGKRNLFYMVRFAEFYPDAETVHALSALLSWTHFRVLMGMDEPLKRDFYAEMCRLERWSTRTLHEKVDGMLYERTALARKPEAQIRQELDSLRETDRLTPDLVFRDPYFLDFLGLKDTFSEKDLEMAILRELESFIMELGAGFSFVARQKRMTVDNIDYYLDLLFYHRGLRRLVALELKLGRFKAAHKGQMELYLRWLQKYEQTPEEEQPMGLILCAGKTSEHVELMRLEGSGIRVAEYLTELPPRELLEKKLRAAVEIARERLASPARHLPSPEGQDED
jgi:predicted nuclease of restriction endonuclease-like (RecB) superfamily